MGDMGYLTGNELGHLFSAVRVGNQRKWLVPQGPASLDATAA